MVKAYINVNVAVDIFVFVVAADIVDNTAFFGMLIL